MANTSAVYARIDKELKENAEDILSQLGISPSSAIQMLYSQIVLRKGMPSLSARAACQASRSPASGCRENHCTA